MHSTDLVFVIVHSRCTGLVSDVPELDKPIASRADQLHAGVDKVDPENRIGVTLEGLDASEVVEAP